MSKTGLYQSKSEFLRDAAREKMAKMLELNKYLVDIENTRKELQKKSKYNGKLSKEEKDKLDRDCLKMQ